MVIGWTFPNVSEDDTAFVVRMKILEDLRTRVIVMASTCRVGAVYFAQTISSCNDCLLTLAKRYSRIFVSIPSDRLASVFI